MNEPIPEFTLERDAAGVLTFIGADGQRHPKAKPVRLFPLTHPSEWVSIVDASGRELACIERGEVPAGKFRKEIEEYATSITSELLSCEKLFGKKDSDCTCPKCGTGRMQFFGKVVRCDNTECGLPIFRLKANRMLTDDEIRELLTKGKTGVLKGFKNKQGKRFDAALVFDADFNTGFVFPERKDGAASAKKRK